MQTAPAMLLMICGLLAVASPAVAADEKGGGYAPVIGPRQWSFPRDHGRHEGFKTEWWYFTGNLRDAGGRRFGYQLTFFRTAFAPAEKPRPSAWGTSGLYILHVAVTDVAAKQFRYADRLQRGRPGLAGAATDTLDVFLLDAIAKRGADGKIRLRAKEKDFALDLVVAPDRDPVLQGPGGVNAKGPAKGQASYYYSMVRMPTTGTITVAGTPFTVEGLSWMDHEFSSSPLSENQSGWDWISLHLADGSALMVYRLRNLQGATDYLSGTHVAPDGRVRYLPPGAVTAEPSNPWKSPTTGIAYPQEWLVQGNGIPTLRVKTVMPGQELTTPETTGVDYFEGAVDAFDEAGKIVGEGYVEMTGSVKTMARE